MRRGVEPSLASLLLSSAEVGGSRHRQFGMWPNTAFVHGRHLFPGNDSPGVIAIVRFSNDEEGDAKIDPKNNARETENDLPGWAKALASWNTTPTERRPPANDDAKNEGIAFSSFPFAVDLGKSTMWENEMSPVVASISGMGNVESLLSAENETDDNEKMGLILPNIEDLRSTAESEINGFASGMFPLQNALRWDEYVSLLQKNIRELQADLIPDDNLSLNETTETDKILQGAAQRLELWMNGSSYALSPSAFQSLIPRASNALAIQEASGNITAAAYSIFEQAGRAPRATAEYTADLVQFASGVVAGGYSPLFSNYPSVKSIPVPEQRQKMIKPAEFAFLSGAIYEDTTPKAQSLGHSIVAEGKTADIGWLVTDSVQYEQHFRTDSKDMTPTLVRTFVFRGYDASDGEVDREGLLNIICTANPVPIRSNEKALVRVHEGMLSIAQELLRELEQYIDLTSPSHKFVFTGHSIGGSLAILLLILMANDRGASFVRENIIRVFTFGSPPIFEIKSTFNPKQMPLEGSECPILDAFDLPHDIVYGYNQPWDPIVRLFSEYDPLYPLIDDLGEDGYTPWVSGPTRTLRPILKTILESWEGWPRYRDNARVKLGQTYMSVGEQFLLLPEPIRYLTDRLVSVNTAVPPISEIMQVSSRELLPSLNEVFKLDTFTISYVSVAIRSFVHHFYPAYGSPFVDYANKNNEGEMKSLY